MARRSACCVPAQLGAGVSRPFLRKAALHVTRELPMNGTMVNGAGKTNATSQKRKASKIHEDPGHAPNQ
jgi:hypothetical protein